MKQRINKRMLLLSILAVLFWQRRQQMPCTSWKGISRQVTVLHGVPSAFQCYSSDFVPFRTVSAITAVR